MYSLAIANAFSNDLQYYYLQMTVYRLDHRCGKARYSIYIGAVSKEK